MSLLQKACETYDHHAHLAGVSESGRATLLPISHIIQKAQLEIVLNRDGSFHSASEVPKEDCRTVIPATEASAARTSAPVAHPLCDQLEYVAALHPKKHEDYLRQLGGWAESEFSHPKVAAVYKYVRGGTILADLASAGLLSLKKDGTLDKGKVAGTDYPKCMIRWGVLGAGQVYGCWTDPELFDAFQRYYDWKLQDHDKDLCMISGEKAVLASNHPKGIVSASYGAKLISANDSSGFTYRGRFSNSMQAATVSYVASQKAHCALQWVASNQGVIIGGRTFLCWHPKGKPVFQPVNSFMSRFQAPTPTPTEYKDQLLATLSGYRQDLPEEESVVIAAFDAATTGRLSLTYYSELVSSDFYDRVQSWFQSCCWYNGPFGIQSPALPRIAECALGTERSKFIEVDDRIKRELVQRLLPCITEGTAVPYDIVQALVRRASMPLAYDSAGNREAVLHTTCALVRKYYNDKSNKEEWTLALDKDKNDRSYQFGRLLAVFEKVEKAAYDTGEEREPNAIRMQAVFYERPMYAADIVHKSLQPYFAKLKPGSRTFYKNLIGEIMEKLDQFSEVERNRPLGPSYLMGYYLQRNELSKSKKAETEEQ